MSGHIRRRGENSFELKYEAGIDPRTGKRITKYASVRGSKREAQAKLAELITAVAKGSHIDTSKVTVAEFVRSRIDQWEASGSISARTAGRYRELNENQIVPHIGAMVLLKGAPASRRAMAYRSSHQGPCLRQRWDRSAHNRPRPPGALVGAERCRRK
ncbi:MAG: hypothetical protein WCB22_05725 [Pseudolabrys sp.]|jgi:hypothetical protein